MNKILTILFLLVSNFILAQAWEPIEETPQYKIEKMHLVCNSNQGYEYDYVVLKFTNLDTKAIELSFNMEKWYGDVCSGCGNESDHGNMQLIQIPALSSLEGSCSSSEDYLKIFHHSVTVHPNAYKTKLTELVINKVQVK